MTVPHSQPTSITLDQAVHGYENGHRLIESSLRLPTESKAALLLLSDMSGPTMVAGFETYLTAYPLVESKVYVFARTWYAPEMQRPGCVWTHSLLIPFSDLARVRSLRYLEQYFRRPTAQSPSDAYDRRIELTPHDSFVPETVSSEDAEAAVLAALYDGPDDPVVIPSRASGEHESLFLRIWEQQWPRLRRSFSFCTGAITPRELNGEPFDLQAAPSTNYRAFLVVPGAQIVGDQSRKLGEEWLSLAAQDLGRGKASELRVFLWTYGADIRRERKSFRPLIQTYSLAKDVLRGRGSVSQLVRTIASEFPSPSDAVRLKRWLLGDVGTNGVLLPKPSRWEVLTELLTSDSCSAFDSEKIGEMTLVTFKTAALVDQRSFLEQLLTIETNGLGQSITAELLETSPLEELLSIAAENDRALSRVLRVRPDIATSPRFWNLSQELLRDNFPILRQAAANRQNIWGPIVSAMLAANYYYFATEALEEGGTRALDGVFEWARHSADVHHLALSWLNSLRAHESLVIEWIKENPAYPPQLELASLVLDPLSRGVHELGIRVWFPAIPPETQRESHHRRLRAFLLTLAFHNPRGNPEALIAEVFQAVHDDLDDEAAWALVEPALSMGGSWLWGSWDRQERLRRTLVDCFLHFHWPTLQLLRAVRNERTLKAIVTYCGSFPEGRTLLREMKQTVPLVTQDRFTSLQRSLLTSSPKKKKKKR